jgi:hypothetical protein
MKRIRLFEKAAISLLCSALCFTPISADSHSDLKIGGALRYNFFYKSWQGQETNRDRGGDLAFDTFRLNLDRAHKTLPLSIGYRFYSGYHMLHHGWLGYNLSANAQLQIGVHQVPFGIQPYASHNWFFLLPYYLGFEDDNDAGIKFLLRREPWHLTLAFYKNDEGHFTGNSLDSARYSYDLVSGLEQVNEETNQFNSRLTYTLSGDSGGNLELGSSVQIGQLYNSATRKNGHHWAIGLHLSGNYARWLLKLEAIRYEHHPQNPPGQNDSYVVMGAYDYPYRVASKSDLYVAGVGFALPVAWGPITQVTLYDDYSLLAKPEENFHNSQQNVLGAMVTAGPIYTYIDLAAGKHHPWIGPDYENSLAKGSSTSGWEMRFNINVGYYF